MCKVVAGLGPPVRRNGQALPGDREEVVIPNRNDAIHSREGAGMEGELVRTQIGNSIVAAVATAAFSVDNSRSGGDPAKMLHHTPLDLVEIISGQYHEPHVTRNIGILGW